METYTKPKKRKRKMKTFVFFDDSRIASIFILFDIQNVLYSSVSP